MGFIMGFVTCGLWTPFAAAPKRKSPVRMVGGAELGHHASPTEPELRRHADSAVRNRNSRCCSFRLTPDGYQQGWSRTQCLGTLFPNEVLRVPAEPGRLDAKPVMAPLRTYQSPGSACDLNKVFDVAWKGPPNGSRLQRRILVPLASSHTRELLFAVCSN